MTGATLTSSTPGTSQAITGLFAVAPTFATLVAPDIIIIVLEPLTAGQQEILAITAYTAGSLDATVTRCYEGTNCPAHTPTGLAWSHDPTAADFIAPGHSGARQFTRSIYR